MAEHYTKEGTGLVNEVVVDDPIAESRKRHHLATADPEPERGIGTETGPAHEKRFGLERAEASAEAWRARGVHPYENRALKPGDEGYVADEDESRGVAPETATEKRGKVETAAAPRPSAA